MLRSCSLLFSIRPSTLRIRLPRVGLCDDSRNVNKALKSIRKQLGPIRKLNDALSRDFPEFRRCNAPADSAIRDFDCNSGLSSKDNGGDRVGLGQLVSADTGGANPPDACDTHVGTDALNNCEDAGSPECGTGAGASALRAEVDSRNRYHKSLWLSMKKRDSLSFNRICQQLRNSGLGLDAVSFTLMINGCLLFSKPGEMDQALGMVEEMKESGVHPSLIRFLARLICLYLEMCYYNARPLMSNWLSVTRSAWLTAYLIASKNRSHSK